MAGFDTAGAVWRCVAALLISVSACSALWAHENEEEHASAVTPEHERRTAEVLGLEGPSETKGITSVESLGAIDLAEEFAALEGRIFRARVITIAPGGVVAVHRHESRPGFAYILEGEAVEHRNDHPEPIVRRAGAMAVERTGVAHWWENVSDVPMRALVVDIVAQE